MPIINDDCIHALKSVPPNSVDLTMFSPPYDKIRDYKEGWTFDYHTLGSELFRVTKDGGVGVVVIQDGTKNFAKSITSHRLVVDWVDTGWKLFETCIYHRHGRPGAWWKKRFRVDHEYIFIFFKGERPKHFDKTHLMVPSKHAGSTFHGTSRKTDGTFYKVEKTEVKPTKCRGTIWFYNTSNTEGSKTKLKHPATYPDKLAEDIVRCFSREGDIVLDPMVGSGTTCIAAAKYNRKYVGIDISEEYCDIAEERLKDEI
jgi:site-specific DNA-methyltransferase (adenine-specific)